MNNRFDPVLAQVKQRIPHVRLPDVGQWARLEESGREVLELTLPRATLSENFQSNACAAPYFLLCFGYWYAQFSGADPLLRVRIEGEAPSDEKLGHHDTRARIGLEALKAGLGERLELVGLPELEWPADLVINAPRKKRSNAGGYGEEHNLESQLCREPHWGQTAPALCGRLRPFRRQLPLGLFHNKVSVRNTWSPRGGAQADLWSTSKDRSTFHLFELKTASNTQVGALPELLTYIWILRRVQMGEIAGGGPGAQAARQAERLKAWWLAPKLHPLLLQEQDSPIRWLAEGLKEHFDLGYLAFDQDEEERFADWAPERSLSFTP